MQGPTNSLHEWTNSTFSNSKFDVKVLLEIHCTFSINNTPVSQNTFILRKVEFRVSDIQLCENIRDRERFRLCIIRRRIRDCAFDTTGVIGKLASRAGAGEWAVDDIDMDGLSGWVCTFLLATNAVSLFAEREAVRGYNTLAVDVNIMLLTNTVSLLSKARAQTEKRTNFRVQSVTSSNPSVVCSFGFSGLT